MQLLILSSCIFNRCEKYDALNFSYNDLMLTPAQFKIDSNLVFSFDNPTDSIPHDSFAIGVGLLLEQVASINFELPSLISAAYATKCHEKTDRVVNNITAIKIITLHKLSDAISANSDITHLFFHTVNRYDKTITEDRFVRIDDYLEEFNKYNGVMYEHNSDLRSRYFGQLYLRYAADPGVHQFLVKLITSDGKFLEARTNTVYLK